MIELRDREQPRAVIERSGRTFRRLANTYSAVFIVNDDPYLAVELGADGVHVGQDDMDPAEARRIVGPDAIIGLSTHSRRHRDVEECLRILLVREGIADEVEPCPLQPLAPELTD